MQVVVRIPDNPEEEWKKTEQITIIIKNHLMLTLHFNFRKKFHVIVLPGRSSKGDCHLLRMY